MKSTIPLLLTLAGVLSAQVPNPTQTSPSQTTDIGTAPIYRVTVVSRTTQAISYRHRSGWTKLDFKGTALAPEAKGTIDVNSRQGYIEVKAKMSKLQSATRFGPEYLTYVMWAITPEGRSKNLGEVLLNGDDSHLDVTTDLQAFGLIVTAEPYFGVTQPSDVVVMENYVRPETLGKFEEINAKFDLLQRGQYTLNVAPARLHPVMMNGKVPLELYEARNAVEMARYAGADRYAKDVFDKSANLLQQAEDYQDRKAGMKPVQMTSREAVQTAENARILSIKRQADEALAQERQAASDREAKANADAAEQGRLQQMEAEKRAQAERDRALAERERNSAQMDRAAAERAKAEADQAAEKARTERASADQARVEAEAAKAAAIAQQQALAADADRSRMAAAESDRLRQKAETDQVQLRKQLLDQLNVILETRDSARGLIVNMSDVLFDFGKYTLHSGTREKLSKISGIVLSHPGLKLEIEGHTDSVGSDEFNQKLSEQRANTVREYLIEQGLSSSIVTARGFGKTQPVASNDNAAGRQQNRRVEMVVSGEVIGVKFGGSAPATMQQPQP